MLKLRSRRNAETRAQAGDTIVEVMIVLAVLGMAIGISYATANRSLMNARQAQEASMATELVQSQIEALQTLAGGGTIYTSDTFCITSGGSGPAVHVPSGSTDTACQMGEDNRYTVTINWNGATPPADSPQPGADTFTVKATWDDIEGQGKDTATMSYRIPVPRAPYNPTPPSAPSGDGDDDGGSTPATLTLAVTNKQCHVYYDGIFGGGYSNNADVVVTGTPGDVVVIHFVETVSIFGGAFSTPTDYQVTLNSSGTATQSVNLGSWYGTVSGTATATDSTTGATAGQVQVCP
jgi:type II secretory pathway pseudopilin PulG